MRNNRTRIRQLLLAASIPTVFYMSSVALAVPFNGTEDDWTGGTGSWSTPGNWSSGVPTSSSDAYFSSTAAQTVTVGSGETAEGVIFNTAVGTSVTTLSGGSILLGDDGLTIGSGTAPIFFTTFELVASQTWNNASTTNYGTAGINFVLIPASRPRLR